MTNLTNNSSIFNKTIAREYVNLIKEYKSYDIFDIINNLEEFIESFGVKVYYSNMDGFSDLYNVSGYSIVKDGKPEIVINANDSYKRQRFTMAHEFGHIIMHWDWLNNQENGLNPKNTEILFRKSFYINAENTKEMQANEFAAELLIPKDVLIANIGNIDEIRNNPFLFDRVKSRVAKAFEVSESFAQVQLNKIIGEDINE